MRACARVFACDRRARYIRKIYRAGGEISAGSELRPSSVFASFIDLASLCVHRTRIIRPRFRAALDAVSKVFFAFFYEASLPPPHPLLSTVSATFYKSGHGFLGLTEDSLDLMTIKEFLSNWIFQLAQLLD
jgi:hypothetical protein